MTIQFNQILILHDTAQCYTILYYTILYITQHQYIVLELHHTSDIPLCNSLIIDRTLYPFPPLPFPSQLCPILS
jgi:hypothetical protein